MSKTKRRHDRNVAVVVAIALLLISTLPLVAETFMEPSTVLYGKVFGTASAQPFLVTEGDLEWTIRRTDGNELTLLTQLRPLNNGEYSYRLAIPHHALALGLAASTGSVPLAVTEQSNTHLRITVGGLVAHITHPGSTVFNVSQARRAATYRLDLEIPLQATDSDGDGMPDWWEDAYGLDKQNPADAVLDADGDGSRNLQEYLNGTNPNHDDRLPTLATTELLVYADGTTGLRLKATDMDSNPTVLVYRLGTIPDSGGLYLRNVFTGGTNCDQLLTAGASFTQADVDRGRLVYVASKPDNGVITTRFELSLQDEDPSHPLAPGSVTLNIYRPAAEVAALQLTEAATNRLSQWPVLAGLETSDRQRAENYLLSRDLAYIVWDASTESRDVRLMVPSSELTREQYITQYVLDYGPDRPQALCGGSGRDRLEGGMESDVLVGGPGDDVLRGNGGADLFVVASATNGSDVIEDFTVSEGDALDLSKGLCGSSTRLTNYLQITRSGTNSYIHVNVNGNGGGYTNMIVTLAGTAFTQDDLRTLVENGNLIVGDKELLPLVEVLASIPAASENGPVSGAFTLTRSGDVTAPLIVSLQFSGTAVNGTDYALIGSQATFEAGERLVTVPIVPYVDAFTELTEVVELSVLPGSVYEVGTSANAQVMIEDLAPQISIEALEPVAVKSTSRPGVFLLTRAGVLDRSVLVRLVISGTASSATDYNAIDAYVNLAAQQATALITITLKSSADLTHGAKSVDLAIKTNDAYRLSAPAFARVLIVDELLAFRDWKERYFAGVTNNLLLFAEGDLGNTGILNIERYAFGLDPINPQQSSGRPEYGRKDDHATVTFRKPASVMDIQYVVETTENLIAPWRSGDNYVESFVDPAHVGQVEWVSYRVRKPFAEMTNVFMRVRVFYTP